MPQKGFYLDMRRCLGCFTCQIICKDKFDLDVDENCRRVVRVEGGQYPTPWTYNFSLSCSHCDRPACQAACPVNAISKDSATGLVLINENTCVGCRKCETACPYGAITYIKASGKVKKCTGCKERVDVGKEPLCVAGCPRRATKFDDIAKLRALPGVVNAIRDYANPALTGPNLVFTPVPRALP